MRRRQPRTLHQYCVARLGVHSGAITAARLIEMAVCTVELGHFPVAAEYAEWACIDERSAWRHRAKLREVFGDDWAQVVEQLAAAAAAGASVHSLVRASAGARLVPA